MRKCVLMFCLFVLAVIAAVVHQNMDEVDQTIDEIVTKPNAQENIAFGRP